MRRAGIEKTAWAGVLGVVLVGAAVGQQPATPSKDKGAAEAPAVKSKLEETLAQALKNNPDIRVAAAKVSEAEAILNQARLQVVQKVVQAYQAVEAAQAMVGFRQKEYERIKELADRKAVSAEIVAERERLLAAAKAQLVAAEAEVAYLVGKPPAGRKTVAQGQGAVWADIDADGTVDIFVADASKLPPARVWDLAAGSPKVASGPIADKVRKVLERPLNIHLTEEPLSKVVKTLREACPEVHLEIGEVDLSQKVSVNWENLSVAAVLQFVEDSFPGYRWVVRDYGLLLRHTNQLPPGALLLEDFRKGSAKPDNRAQRDGSTPSPVDGEVVELVAKTDLLKLSLGSNAGLAKGQTLEVYRPEKDGKPAIYLGRVRIIEVGPTNAFAKREDKGLRFGPIQAGDRVVGQIVDH
jgi:hypothetical protein